MTYRLTTPTGIVESTIPGLLAGWRPGKIYGRLDCKSGMRMLKKNRIFFADRNTAEACGYRACKKCKP